jgi:hypothetical protein
MIDFWDIRTISRYELGETRNILRRNGVFIHHAWWIYKEYMDLW